MDFGTVARSELSGIDFSLPIDPVSNKEILATGSGNTQLYLGCASTKEKLNVYAKECNCIELNGTYYNLPTKKQVELWRIAVPDGFRYAAKFPQKITHVKRLVETEIETTEFLNSVKDLSNKLGALFLMPHPQMDARNIDLIQNFISKIPKKFSTFLELRHPSWFTNGYNYSLLSFLRAEQRGTIITDAAGRRDAVHMHLSSPDCFVRFVGNSLHETDYFRIDGWVERIKRWREQGLNTCYFFIHQEDYKDSIILLEYLKLKLR